MYALIDFELALCPKSPDPECPELKSRKVGPFVHALKNMSFHFVQFSQVNVHFVHLICDFSVLNEKS